MRLAYVVWFGGAAITTAVITAVLRRWALRSGLLDIPNARSSHSLPTPRGGGLAIVAIVLAGVVLLCLLRMLDARMTGALIFGSAVIAMIGYIDDKRGLSPGLRLLVHFIVAISTLLLMISLGTTQTVFAALPLTATFAFLIFGVVWSTNLFNFMDGIDGLAGSQAMFMAGASAGLLVFADAGEGWINAFALTSGACAGFLIFNLPPAKIFMGDVGSAFLGFWLAASAVALHVAGAQSLWTSIALGMLFIADATATLIRRIAAGEVWYAAHRSHLYQRLARRFGHRRVTLGAVLTNVAIVFPCALATQHAGSLAPCLVSILLVTCIAVCWIFGAGKPEVTRS